MFETDERLDRALAVAYAYLNRRDRTTSEVRRHLAQHGVAAAEVDGAVARLREQGCLDDARFARLFAEDKRALEQWGADRIRRALGERGIDREIVEAALATDGSEDEAGELERALVVLQRRFPERPVRRRDRDRALGMLLRKGFDAGLALDALAVYTTQRGNAQVEDESPGWWETDDG